MKSRPILFSGPMVRALLDGRKTQTRRAVKGTALEWLQPGMFTPEYVADPGNALCPYGVPGDRLWVKETHAVVMPSKSGKLEYDGARLIEDTEHGTPVEVWYRADGELGVMSTMFDDGPRWKPSIHMRREYSRLTLEVTGVRVERVQDISEADAKAEGCDECGWDTARDEFAELWVSINGVESWDANPWVWVVGFKVVAQ